MSESDLEEAILSLARARGPEKSIDPSEPAKQVAAATAVAQGATDGGASAVADAYHAGLVPPFCLAAVKDFFAAR